MAVDFQVVFPQEAVTLSSVRVLPGPPRVIDVQGADFRSVDDVFLNRVASPDVVILSRTRLLAQVPDSQLEQEILSVNVLSRRLTVSSRSVLRFRISKTPGKVSGILKLVQKFLMVLFKTPGSDIFNKASGTNALRSVGSTFNAGNGNDIVHNLVIAVDTASKQIVSTQSRNSSLPRDERLLSAKVLRASFNKEEGAIDIAVEITSQAGKSATANLEI